MTAPLKPSIRLLGGCARAASILAVSSASMCFAQQSVATLGIPSASSAVGPMVFPGLADEPTKTADAVVGAPGMFLSAFAESPPAEPVLSAAADNSAPTPESPTVNRWTPTLQRMSGTPAGPQLSPSKWVHQPLFADHVQQPEGTDPTEAENPIGNNLHPVTEIPTATHVRPLTEIRRAAMRQRASRTEETFVVPRQSEPIQPGYSIDALRKSATDLIAEAQLKLDTRAFLTAEGKAIAALELIAQAIDTREQSALASRDLMVSLTAIREAEDFVGRYGMVDGEAITRMVRSHATEILKPYNTSKLNGLAAADVYLDWSRRCMTPLAIADPLGSEAIRILAHSHRLRDDGTPFGIATAVHLLRAATDGAPDNHQVRRDYEATLQIAGLSGRSQISQVHNTTSDATPGQMVTVRPASTFPGQPNRDVEILEVSPEQFAAISPAVAGPPGTANPQSMPWGSQHAVQHHTQNYQQRGPYRPEHVNEASPNQAGPMQAPDSSVKGRLSRAFNPITRLLR